MTVRELITMLKQMPQDKEIKIELLDIYGITKARLIEMDEYTNVFESADDEIIVLQIFEK